MSDKLLDFQHAIKNYLVAQEFFSNSRAETPVPIPIVTEDAANLEADIEKAVAEVGGICVLIQVPGGEIKSADAAVPIYDPAYVHIRIYENPTINRQIGGTFQPACKVADAIIRLIYRAINYEGFPNPLYPIYRKPGTDADGLPFYDLMFRTTCALDDAEPSRDESLLAEDGTPLLTEAGNNLIIDP